MDKKSVETAVKVLNGVRETLCGLKASLPEAPESLKSRIQELEDETFWTATHGMGLLRQEEHLNRIHNYGGER